jgi:hypothetical protein
MRLTPEGLRRGRKLIAAETEAEIYEVLGLQYIEPELREGLDEIERAAAHNIPPLVTATDLLERQAAELGNIAVYYDKACRARYCSRNSGDLLHP